jgi:hypothetical protein
MATEGSSSSGLSPLDEVIESIDSVIAESGEKKKTAAAAGAMTGESSGVTTITEVIFFMTSVFRERSSDVF